LLHLALSTPAFGCPESRGTLLAKLPGIAGHGGRRAAGRALPDDDWPDDDWPDRKEPADAELLGMWPDPFAVLEDCQLSRSTLRSQLTKLTGAW
jgi:hypothetical protein